MAEFEQYGKHSQQNLCSEQFRENTQLSQVKEEY